MSVLLLSRADLAALMHPRDYLEAVEAAFRAYKEDRAEQPMPLHLAGIGGAFHAKGAVLRDTADRAALKLNANFPSNPQRGLPTIQGVILLFDAANGAPLAIMDSIEITLGRTAAASALAARHLARRGASRLAICGCGAQALPHGRAMAEVLALEGASVWDIDSARAERLGKELSEALNLSVSVAPNVATACSDADVIVTCTTSRAPFISEAVVAPGAFIAAVGADNPEKSEIAPALMAKAKVVVDVLEQCLAMGDLHHAVEHGTMNAAQVHADLGDIIIGAKRGRATDYEIIIFNSTGAAIQDAASAVMAHTRALASDVGHSVTLS